MTDEDLESFVSRARTTLDREEDLSAANTDLRVVLPLLKALGWDVHGPEVVADYAVGVPSTGETAADEPDDDRVGSGPETKAESESEEQSETGAEFESESGSGRGEEVVVDYALTLEGDPTVLVVTAGAGTELSSEHGDRLRAAMAATEVDQGIVTNGRSFVFVAVDDDELRQVNCPLPELPERESLLSLYTRRAARARQERRRERDRERVGKALQERRDETAGAVTEALTRGLEGPVTAELKRAAERFVDDVVTALESGRPPGSPDRTSGDDEDRETGGDGAETADGGATGAESEPDASGEDATEEVVAEATGGGHEQSVGTERADPRNEAAPMSRNRTNEEYVVRFFDGHSSVGAVGNATSAGAVAQTVQYLVEQHALDNRLDLPWTPDDIEAVDPSLAVVNRDPVHPDGDRMEAPRQIANGYHVETAMDADVAREVVETLAGRSGLRVMFQGAW